MAKPKLTESAAAERPAEPLRLPFFAALPTSADFAPASFKAACEALRLESDPESFAVILVAPAALVRQVRAALDAGVWPKDLVHLVWLPSKLLGNCWAVSRGLGGTIVSGL